MGEVFKGVEKEWRMFREAILEVGEEVWRARRIKEGIRRKGGEWRSEETRKIVERKNECFLVWRRMKRKEALKEYKRMKGMVKRIVWEVKKGVKGEWAVNIAESFKENKNTFWEGVKWN